MEGLENIYLSIKNEISDNNRRFGSSYDNGGSKSFREKQLEVILLSWDQNQKPFYPIASERLENRSFRMTLKR